MGPGSGSHRTHQLQNAHRSGWCIGCRVTRRLRSGSHCLTNPMTCCWSSRGDGRVGMPSLLGKQHHQFSGRPVECIVIAGRQLGVRCNGNEGYFAFVGPIAPENAVSARCAVLHIGFEHFGFSVERMFDGIVAMGAGTLLLRLLPCGSFGDSAVTPSQQPGVHRI